MKTPPPQSALKFLRWFCRDEYLEEIEGNLLELYAKQHEQLPQRAKWQFVGNVLRHFRPAFIRSFKIYCPQNHRAMIRHNFLLTFRNFQRYKSTFLINLIGLSSGLACALLIFLWVQDELQVDAFHKNDAQLYQIMEQREQGGETVMFKTTSGLTAEALVEEIPEVAYATTVDNSGGGILTIDDKYIEADGRLIGGDFFRLFSYKLTQGDPSRVLPDKTSMVISEGLAKRLFGTTEDIMGQVVELNDQPYQVSGVFEDIPANSTLRFDYALSFEAYQKENAWATDWSKTNPFTYVLLKPGADADVFNAKITDFVKTKTNGEIMHRTLFAQPYSDTYLYGNYENGVQAGGRITYVRLFSVIAVFILLIACINFMNLSTAKASRRMKEVGVKKAVGASRMSLAWQYLSESMTIAFLSLMLATLLVVLILPRFSELTGKELTLTLDPELMLAALGITTLAGLMAGSYPALYLSGFNPTEVLKNKLNRSVGEQWTRQGLVVLQFVLSVILITSVWVVYQQIAFVQNEYLGYNKDNVLYFERLGFEKGNLETFLAEVEKVPGVVQASSIGHNMTEHNASTYRVQWEGRDPNDKTEFEFVWVDYGTMELFDIAMKEGRTFSESFSTDTAKIIFNEAAIDYMGLTDPIGKVIELWGNGRNYRGSPKLSF